MIHIPQPSLQLWDFDEGEMKCPQRQGEGPQPSGMQKQTCSSTQWKPHAESGRGAQQKAGPCPLVSWITHFLQWERNGHCLIYWLFSITPAEPNPNYLIHLMIWVKLFFSVLCFSYFLYNSLDKVVPKWSISDLTFPMTEWCTASKTDKIYLLLSLEPTNGSPYVYMRKPAPWSGKNFHNLKLLDS